MQKQVHTTNQKTNNNPSILHVLMCNKEYSECKKPNNARIHKK